MTSSYLPKLGDPPPGTCRCFRTLILAPIRAPPPPLLAGSWYLQGSFLLSGLCRMPQKIHQNLGSVFTSGRAQRRCAKLSPCSLVNTDLSSVLDQSNQDRKRSHPPPTTQSSLCTPPCRPPSQLSFLGVFTGVSDTRCFTCSQHSALNLAHEYALPCAPLSPVLSTRSWYCFEASGYWECCKNQILL